MASGKVSYSYTFPPDFAQPLALADIWNACKGTGLLDGRILDSEHHCSKSWLGTEYPGAGVSLFPVKSLVLSHHDWHLHFYSRFQSFIDEATDNMEPKDVEVPKHRKDDMTGPNDVWTRFYACRLQLLFICHSLHFIVLNLIDGCLWKTCQRLVLGNCKVLVPAQRYCLDRHTIVTQVFIIIK